LEKLVWCQVVAGQQSHVAGQLGGVASTDFLHCLGLLLLVQTRVLKATGQTNIKHGRPGKEIGRPAFGPFRVGVWPTRSMCQIHPRGDQDFDIWSTLLCHPLKYSNLVPKLLKSNKHYYSSWNYVSRQGEYMVILYIYST
jgi:hypothetical protein